MTEYTFSQKPNYTIRFRHQDGREVGCFDFNGDQMVFTGNADEAAKVFIDYAMMYFQQRLRDEREACAQICDKLNELWPDEGGTPGCCAADIRARSEK